MYTMIRKHYIIPGMGGEWMQRVQKGLVPLLKEVPEFLAYYDVEVRTDEVVSISMFETQAGAQASQPRIARWTLEHLTPLLQTFPEITVGHVKASSEPVHLSSSGKAGEKRAAFPEYSNMAVSFFLPG
jgi:hypothetical protein